MKPTKPRIHLLDVAEPLFAFRDLTVRCGVTLHNAEVKFMVEQDIATCMLPPMQTCMKCWDAAPETAEAKRRYEYGLVEAQEARNAVA